MLIKLLERWVREGNRGGGRAARSGVRLSDRAGVMKSGNGAQHVCRTPPVVAAEAALPPEAAGWVSPRKPR